MTGARSDEIDRTGEIPEPVVQELRDMGVRTVVLHPDIVDGTAWEDWRTWDVEGTPTGDVILYRLR